MAVVVPLIVVGFFSVNKASDALVKGARGTATQIAQDLVDMTDITLAQEIKLAKAMAIDSKVIDAVTKVAEVGIDNAFIELKSLDSFLGNIFKAVGNDYNVLFVTDSNGGFISDSNDGAYRTKKLSVAERDYFLSVKKTGKVIIGSPVLSKTSGKPISVIAIPLTTVSGQFAGIFGLSLKLDVLSKHINEIKVAIKFFSSRSIYQ